MLPEKRFATARRPESGANCGMKHAGLLPLLYLLCVIAGCGGSGGGASPEAMPPDMSIDLLSVDLSNFVRSSLVYAARDSEGYQPVTSAELAVFADLVVALLNGQTTTARSLAESLDLNLLRVIDSGGAGSSLYCVREIIPKGRGFYCIDYGATSSIHLSVPHPLYDLNTNQESIVVMRGTGAKYLSISTTHRCANAANTSCSGTTSACGASGPYKVSDMAHNVDTFFQHFSELVHDGDAASVNIQLHGCGASPCPANMDAADIVARLSAGTNIDLAASEPVNRVAAHLQTSVTTLIDGASVKSCSEAGETDRVLCGTTNTQGRYINGEAMDACQTAATMFEGSRFLHVEQNFDLRRDDGAGDLITPALLIDAINAEISP